MRKLLTILLLFISPFGYCQIIQTHGIIQSQASSCSDADAAAYCTASGITDAAQQTAICEFVVREKAASRWGTEVQAFYIHGNGSFNSTKYNLIDTTTYTLTSSGTITYSTGSGGGADPTSGAYLTMNFTPSTQLVSINSMHLMFFSQENVNETSTDIGRFSVYYADIELYNTVIYSTLNRLGYASYLTSALSTTAGMFLSNRTSSTAVEIFQNTTSLASGSITADAAPTASILIFTSNLTNFSTKKVAFTSVGAAISDPTGYYNSVNDLKTALGL